MIQPLRNLVLVKPDPPPDLTRSGLVIPDTADQPFEMSGTVVKTADGPESSRRVRVAMIKRVLDILSIQHRAAVRSMTDNWQNVFEETERIVGCLLNEQSAATELQAGDHVAFAYTAGTVIEVDHERYLLIPEDQIAAILDREDVTV